MKRILSIILTAVMILSLAPLSTLSASAVTDSQGLIYTLSEDNTYYVDDCDESVTSVVILAEINGLPVTKIDYDAFYNCTSLTSITIPNSVTIIGDRAFCNCISLTSIEIPDSVTTIVSSAFLNCTSLTSIELPDSVTEIGPSVFSRCTSLTSIEIPDSVTSIGHGAFSNCTSLTSIEIPASVTTIVMSAFSNCTSLTSIEIPASVTAIDWNPFSGCSSLASITVDVNNEVYHSKDNCLIETATNKLIAGCKNSTIPNYVTTIGFYAFAGCSALTSIEIPDSVTSIGRSAFSNCTSLTSIEIPDSVTIIVLGAFYACDFLTDIYCQAESQPKGWDKDWLDNCSATVHWGTTATEPNPINPGSSFKQWYFEEPIVIFDIGETKTLNVHSRDVANVNGELVYSNDKVVNASDIDWNAELYEDSGVIKIDDNGQITGLSEGYEHILINSKNDLNLSTFCHVYVGDPNVLNYTSTYDTKQYYADGGFYSEVSSISDCVEIYILLENKLKEAVANISGIDEIIAKDTEKETFKDIKPITLTASVNGTGLSFDRDTYTNTYTVTLDAISLTQAVDDILMLFPNNLTVASSGNNYTVTVSLESESFETLTDEYSFTIENLETKSANEHIDFISSNKDYKISKQNIYGETMVTLKTGDYKWYEDEYNWSKYSTFDFENYYEVVFADILIELMNTSQLGHVSLLPVVKEWVGNYKTILSEVSTIVEDDYTGYLNVTDNAIDKVLKKSKYTTEGMDVHDEIRDLVVLKLRDKVSIDKVNSAFAAIDKTQQYFSFFELSVDITNDIADFIDGVSVLNAYKDMDDEFKAVIQNLYNQIPSSEKKLKDAVYHYVNVDSYLGYSSEILNEVRDMAGDITLDVFNTLFKKQVVSSICNAIGNITLKSGALLSSTTAFSTISTGLGAVATGATLGICISDILCDNSGKAAEMSKVVAMSEFAQYIINTLNHYESKLYNDRNDNAVSLFEYAFALHKATQGYIMQHTVNSLETKSDSLIIKLFSRDDYDGLITDILAQKRTMDNLQCHNTNSSSTVASNTKVIAIKCPVNVFVCDESGKEVVRIVDNIKEYVADGIDVFVEGGEKYIALPTDQKYSVKIIATDSGTMEYTVTEYGAGTERLRTITKDNIPLINNREFNGQIVKMMDVEPSSYALVYNNTTIFPDDVKIHTLLGDINGDSYIDNLDAAMVLKYDAGIIETINVDRSDVNNDGSADNLDAAMILKYDAGIIDSL